jgi:hypothetical protein
MACRWALIQALIQSAESGGTVTGSPLRKAHASQNFAQWPLSLAYVQGCLVSLSTFVNYSQSIDFVQFIKQNPEAFEAPSGVEITHCKKILHCQMILR